MSYKKEISKTMQYIIKARTIAPLSIRDEKDTIKKDELTGAVYIPGTSIAGAFRGYYETTINPQSNKEDNLLFGGLKTGMSSIVFYDAYAVEDEIQTSIHSRPGVMIDPKTLSAGSFSDEKKSGGKFTRNFLEEGTQFEFRFEINENKETPIKDIENIFETLLKAFAVGDIALGSNKMIGYGRFEVENVKKSVCDFKKMEDIIGYLSKKPKQEDITASFLESEYESKYIVFEIKGRTTAPLLIKDEVIASNEEPDGIQIKDREGNAVIPGSSLKGVLRSRAEKIVHSFPQMENSVIENIFGKVSDTEEEGHISRWCCYDSKIPDAKICVYNKIKIDHFTGGVMQGALTNDETIMGDVTFKCALNPFGMKAYQKEIGLLLLVLRDLCTQDLTIGSGFAVGRGYIKAKTLCVKGLEDNPLLYDFEQPNKGVEAIFNTYITKLLDGGASIESSTN